MPIKERSMKRRDRKQEQAPKVRAKPIVRHDRQLTEDEQIALLTHAIWAFRSQPEGADSEDGPAAERPLPE
jgi:hypothetical protein